MRGTRISAVVVSLVALASSTALGSTAEAPTRTVTCLLYTSDAADE